MALSVTIVLAVSNVVVAALRQYIPDVQDHSSACGDCHHGYPGRPVSQAFAFDVSKQLSVL
jgi:Na+-transporting NADH:ubiquinone oxidoreductase subunit NqrD